MRAIQICPHCGVILPKKGPEITPRTAKPACMARCPDCRGYLMPVPQPDIKDIFRIPLLLLYFAGIAASVLWDYRDPVPAVTRISGLRLLLCLSPAMIVSAISAKRHSRLVRHQKWSAAMQTDESPYYAPLYRKPTHTAKYRADALFEQDILQVKGRETYLLMRRVTADTVDFCTVPFSEEPKLPESLILHDGAEDAAELSDIRKIE